MNHLLFSVAAGFAGAVLALVALKVKRLLYEKWQARKRPIPFDNRWDWLSQAFNQIVTDEVCAKRPHYIWGVLQGAALGKVLGRDAVSVIEFGVAGGAGIRAMERAAAQAEKLIGIRIDVYGFDTGRGLPKTQDYRDLPNIWLDGMFPMDQDALKRSLSRAKLRLGLVKDTVPEFIGSNPVPVAFVSFDLDLYTSTRDALALFEADYSCLLPRVLCYFDDIIGLTYADFNGARLAIAEFTAGHARRKLSPLYGMKFYVPHHQAGWPELFYFAHFFDHPLYGCPDEVRKPMYMDMDGQTTGYVDSVKGRAGAV